MKNSSIKIMIGLLTIASLIASYRLYEVSSKYDSVITEVKEIKEEFAKFKADSDNRKIKMVVYNDSLSVNVGETVEPKNEVIPTIKIEK